MSALADQLYDLYKTEIYAVLANNDPVYKVSLAKAGLGWNPRSVPAGERASFEQEMRMQAWLAAERVQGARSLDLASVRAKVLSGPATLYRVSESGSNAPAGIWWFNEQVAQRCRAQAGSSGAKQLEWLRDVLAVCFNWSNFNRVERFTLHAGERIPAVIGRGLPMPYYKADSFVHRRTGERLINLPADYWQRQGQMLLGGEMQIVLPWVPVQRVATTDHV